MIHRHALSTSILKPRCNFHPQVNGTFIESGANEGEELSNKLWLVWVIGGSISYSFLRVEEEAPESLASASMSESNHVLVLRMYNGRSLKI
jgi:hypothetical protein